MADELIAHIEPVGATSQHLTELTQRMLSHPLLAQNLAPKKHFVLSVVPEEPDSKGEAIAPPKQFKATIYDYAQQRTLVARTQLDAVSELKVTELAVQPLPSEEEFAAAMQIVERDPNIGPRIKSGAVSLFHPMPPLVETRSAEGHPHRVIAVGMQNAGMNGGHRIVGVDLAAGSVVHSPVHVPLPDDRNCGPVNGGGCDGGGGDQMANVTIRQGNTVLWEMTVVRPSASTGTNGSGVELRHVRYRGKTVLYRANVPILNVEYDADGAAAGCGPTYRDWQNSETCFDAHGADPVPGFRLCTSPAKTILDSGVDGGNFKGVAIYVQGQEVVLVSQLQAGWYRYVSQWRFATDGTIRPRFGFAATNNPCTCHAHHHHAYWRFDFDIETPGQNLVEEFNNPPLIAGQLWHKKRFEIRRDKDAARKRFWRVSNTHSHAAYEIHPGANDGTADAFGGGDFWALHYHGSTPPPSGEEDDGQGFTTNSALSREHIDKFVNGEVIENEDVVVWYGAHFFHDEMHQGNIPHIVGPDLKPHQW